MIRRDDINKIQIKNELVDMIIENKYYYWLNNNFVEMFEDKNIGKKIKKTENAIKGNGNI